VPALWNVNEKLPPGATVPEFQPAASDVDVWGTESLLVHVTVVPACTSATSGLKAVVVSTDAPTGIETDVDDPDGAGDGLGVGDDGEDPPLHAIENITSMDTTDKRNDFIATSWNLKLNPLTTS
jgi:hypothetical protein